MTTFMWTLSGLAAVTLIAYMAIPIARMIKHLFRQRDIAEVMYPGDKARQAGFRDKVASEILQNNRELTYESPEFQSLYRQEMDRLLQEYQR
ncbi:hypothetical protein [Syntrophorhabdus aromaticivorans]|uniref:Uncharacterized protein n=1 Tax=Syntrophorhabdus aromaticivorans TaxID=328301 RepID=A0A971M719_9BACT|nr:hypothetical protein [Syntrophorhabdus aromaticivorans]NLW36366.1 hypothetical protein [Syntrophorhabdus aromaticivorans]